MKSIVFWFEPKQINGDRHLEHPELELHLNHWKLNDKKSKKDIEYFLDVGVKIKNGANVGNVCFYLPDEIEEIATYIEDLGGKLKERRLLTAVFNENYSSTIGGNKYFEVKQSGKSLFYIYSLDVKADLQIEKKFQGSILKFEFQYFKQTDTYYRLRLKKNFVKKFSVVYRPKNSFLESIFSSVELIDIKINDTRNTHLSLLEHIEKNGKMFNLSLVHLFVMRNINDEYIISDLNLNSIRQLEEHTWNSYLDEKSFKYQSTIAYHLKAKVTEDDKKKNRFIEDYNALIKFRFEDRQLLKYFIYLLLFALLTEVSGSALYDILGYLVSCFKN